MVHVQDTAMCGCFCYMHILLLPVQATATRLSCCCNWVCLLQDAKLLRLEASLQNREEQIENHHAKRIDALRTRRSREVQKKLAYLHRYSCIMQPCNALWLRPIRQTALLAFEQ